MQVVLCCFLCFLCCVELLLLSYYFQYVAGTTAAGRHVPVPSGNGTLANENTCNELTDVILTAWWK